MRSITKLSEIDFKTQETVEFEATVLSVIHEGDIENKRPMKASIKFEESGETFDIVSWTFDLLDLLKESSKNLDVLRFEGLSGTFRDQKQLRIGKIEKTEKKSTKKIIKTVDIASIKREMGAILNKYITTFYIRDMLEALVMNNPDFFTWPAAKKIHHDYNGGLALHTLQVMKHAVSIWEIYQGALLDIEVIVAGAMLHDIGKIREYNEDGSKTMHGELVSHIVDGSEIVSEYCFNNMIDPFKDEKIKMIKHIILSHHNKLEFGSPNTPAILEAVVVSRADEMDATFEAVKKELDNTVLGEYTNRLFVADGGRFLRWH